jgi:hypothetical protein
MIGLLMLATAAGALGTAAPAAAALDSTTTTVACSPTSDATGTASTCTATVTDTQPTPQGAPTGQVTFTAAPNSGTFSGGGACTLPASAGETVSCHLTFTPSAGGGYTISGAYSADTTHSASGGSGSLTAIDPTTTSFTCTNSTLQIDSSTECTATLTDASSPQAPGGSVTFSSSPTTGTFGAPGACNWQASGSGGSATCEVTFAPSSVGGYTLSAAYSGDSLHSASTGTFGLTATTTPANGGPGSHPGTTGTLTVPVSNGPPPPATLTVARNARVSSKHRAALKLSCAGAAGTSCVGKLTLATVVKVKTKSTSKGKHSKKHQPKPTTTTKLVTTIFGSVKYDLAPGRSHTFAVKLSNKGLKLLVGARRGKLKVTAYAANFFTSNVTLLAPKHSKHKKHKKKKKKKK